MRFEPVKKEKKENKIQKLINQFLQSKHEKVEVFNEDDYESNNKMISAMRFVIKNHYNGVVNVSKINDHVYLYKTSEKSNRKIAN